jgi:lysophospholipase L1-like esterase
MPDHAPDCSHVVHVAITAVVAFLASARNPEASLTRRDQNGLAWPASHNSRFDASTMHTFLALGDSYTIGEGVPGDRNWPSLLVARLHSQGIEFGEPRIVATTGWTTDELRAAMEAATLTPPYALVTLSIGVNNQYRGRPVEEYRAQFRALLDRAVALAGGAPSRVVVVSIPDWGVTPFATREGRDAASIARATAAFHAAARAETDDARAHWVDVTTVSRAPGARSELAADGLHPSAAQYARWVDAILPVARRVLRRD